MLLLKISDERRIKYLCSLHPEGYDKKNIADIEITLKSYK